MVEDPRRGIVEVMARLSKETQLHLDERHRHFKVTDAVIISVSIMLVVAAMFNIYFVQVLYNDMDDIVTNMDSMYESLLKVDVDMASIANNVGRFDVHVQHMQPINDNMITMSETLPGVRGNMDAINGDMGSIQHDMALISTAMGNVNQRIQHMGSGMAVMRNNVRQMAKPMGMMNSFMP